MTRTAAILDFAAADHCLPGTVRTDTLRLLADTLAVGAAGASAPGADAILSAARAMGSGADARLIGSADRLPAPGAAFVNGYRVHCLEWDAVHEPAVVHALSTVTAALGAAIDRRGGCDPEDALTALAVGVDIASGIGIAADSALTFFRPATAGMIGAALAVARIDGAPLQHTLGLVYSSAAGTMQAHAEGSIALPFQIANGARAAVTASDLAKAGFTGPLDPLEGPFGYFKLFDTGDLGRYVSGLGEIWRISEISTKPFPSGRASHAALGVLSLLPNLRLGRGTAAEGGGGGVSQSAEIPLHHPADGPPPQSVIGEEIAAIEIFAPPLIHRLVGRPMHAGMTPAYARLCLPFLAALMLRDGVIDPRCFTPAAFADPALAAMAERISVIVDGNPDANALSPQTVRATMADGRVIEHTVPATLGSPDAPLDPAQASAKLNLARALAAPTADPRLFADPLSYFTDPI